MDPISSPQPAPEVALHAKKRGVFLPNRFFSGKDKEPISQTDVKPDAAEQPLPEATAPEAVAAPEPLVSKLALAGTPVPAPPPAASSDHPSSPNMTPSEPTIHRPDSHHAAAQLTLGFEITSLQLTPVFKLGGVQLKALSNVALLHLVSGARTENPLAAAVAFAIEHVELDGGLRLKSLLLKPLGEARELAAPQPRLQVDGVTLGNGDDRAPISVATATLASTVVQLFGTFRIAAMDFTPAFEVGSLRLEPTSNTVLVRVAPSPQAAAQDLPPAFELAEVQINGDGTQITGARLLPNAATNS